MCSTLRKQQIFQFRKASVLVSSEKVLDPCGKSHKSCLWTTYLNSLSGCDLSFTYSFACHSRSVSVWFCEAAVSLVSLHTLLDVNVTACWTDHCKMCFSTLAHFRSNVDPFIWFSVVLFFHPSVFFQNLPHLKKCCLNFHTEVGGQSQLQSSARGSWYGFNFIVKDTSAGWCLSWLRLHPGKVSESKPHSLKMNVSC